MATVKLIVAYPPPSDTEAFEKLYSEEHVPLAVAKLAGKTKIVATRILASPQGKPAFYRVAEVYFPSMAALEACAASTGGKEVLANATKISSGGTPVIMVAEEDTFTFWERSLSEGDSMSDIVYRSEVRIERIKGPKRRAYLPAEAEPVIFGVHGAVAEHYKVSPTVSEPHATTLDYIVAAAAGWLTGTFGGALEARKIDASNERLVSEAVGEIELEDQVLVIRRIHIVLKLKARDEDWETARRVHSLFAEKCPVYRSLKNAVSMTTELKLEPTDSAA